MIVATLSASIYSSSDNLLMVLLENLENLIIPQKLRAPHADAMVEFHDAWRVTRLGLA